jgi:hypothetical protein
MLTDAIGDLLPSAVGVALSPSRPPRSSSCRHPTGPHQRPRGWHRTPAEQRSRPSPSGEAGHRRGERRPGARRISWPVMGRFRGRRWRCALVAKRHVDQQEEPSSCARGRKRRPPARERRAAVYQQGPRRETRNARAERCPS